MLASRDVDAFVRYRNVDAIARFQEWPLPYTRALAEELVDALDELSGPTPGGWVQLAIEHDGDLIGDVAVWLDEAGQLAMIGYTLAPEHHGHGFATEAVEAVVDWLFRQPTVHRIAATIDPRNLASARVLENCGFEYVGTARSAALVRGEWTDDARYSLSPDDWTAWRHRDTGPPDRVDLVEITADNLVDVLSVDRAFSQRHLVASVETSLAQAHVPPIVEGEAVRPWVRAVTADGRVVGFVMLAEPTASRPHPYLWRLVIDRAHQGRGIGRRVVHDIAVHQRAAGNTRLLVHYVPDVPGSPERFYTGLGFVPTGEVDHDEVEAALDLTVTLLGRPRARP